MSSNKIFVNGPINVVRLNGDVGKLNKTIYLFMDFHIDPNYQTKCEDIRSQDVGKYVVDIFDKSMEKNPDLTYDFFMERGPLRPYLPNKKYKASYIDQMSELFTKSFNIDVKKKIVQKSPLVPNVRFHYADIRDYIYDWTNNSDVIFGHNLWNAFNLDNFTRIQNYINTFGNEMFELHNIIYKDTKISNPKIDTMLYSPYKDIRFELPKEFFDTFIKKIIYKIRKAYKNEDVKKKINGIIDTDLLSLYNIFFGQIGQLTSKLQKLIDEHKKFEGYNTNEILLQQNDGTYDYNIPWINSASDILMLENDINLIYETYMGIGVMLMDLYLLRRFLDKEYITNAVAYTGASHSRNYIRLLVKYFGFKITHYSYLKNNDIDKGHEIIKKSQNDNELNVLFFPVILLQCSDMTNFPPLLT